MHTNSTKKVPVKNRNPFEQGLKAKPHLKNYFTNIKYKF